MALVEVQLAPAWKHVTESGEPVDRAGAGKQGTSGESADRRGTDREDADQRGVLGGPPVWEDGPERVAVDDPGQDATAPGAGVTDGVWRRLSARRLLVVASVDGAVAFLRRWRRSGDAGVDDAPGAASTLDVDPTAE
jgi:hypothetical protein